MLKELFLRSFAIVLVVLAALFTFILIWVSLPP